MINELNTGMSQKWKKHTVWASSDHVYMGRNQNKVRTENEGHYEPFQLQNIAMSFSL